MKRVIKYVSLFVAVFFASVIYHAPAQVLLSVAPLPSNVVISGVQGTIWQGRAQNVNYQRQQLGEVSWHFSWLSILTLSPEYAVRFGRGSALGIAGKGNIGVNFSGPYVHTLLASLPAESILDIYTPPVPINAGGQVELAIRSMQYQSPWCGSGDGSLSWNAGYVETPVGSLSFGPTVIDMTCSDSTIKAKGAQNSAQVSSEFTGELSANRQYQTQAWFKPGSDFPPSMQQQLKWFGNPDNQGRYSFNYQGRF
ncbi:type II secretion system protein N [Vibrio methylphosphonaticus]|uniref:type II secretion system protein N n=1 Tax=Vibrio methylphosphonaticus TaxID=2946866 RepID=UPI002029CD9C|nr:type II secretion system protein N [Vibrio methylphosphonaticus]MCL9776449.1 type II secretion system protein N [Vibrio methylphosphonaticus]